jgi:hypothetical protein
MTLAIDMGIATGPDRATLSRQIEQLISRLNPRISAERRRDGRVPIPVFFLLTPLDIDRQPIEAEATTVVGKNICRCGLSFFHERPITHRRALISLAQPGLGQFVAEIDINRCRFTRPGWYESGGRLLRLVTPRGKSPAHSLESIGSRHALELAEPAA